MKDGGILRHLTDDDVAGLGLGYPEIVGALRAAFAGLDPSGRTITPKVAARGVDEGFFHAMPAVFGDLAVVKWVASGALPTRSYICANLIATDRRSGEPLAFIDFKLATGLRTAAVSALGADLLTRPGARTLSIVGLGLQARCHLDALRAVRPVGRVVACGRSEASRSAFAAYAEARGVAVRTTAEADYDSYASE